MNNENVSNVKKLLMGMPNNPAAIVALEALAKVEADFKSLSLKLETMTLDRDAEMQMKVTARAARDKMTKGYITSLELLEEVLNDVPHGWGESFSDSELADKIRIFVGVEK